ncbi:unnamed protein product [Rotaria sordida]|uniref:PLAT domain-containing protein n=1 Tax=Rotaria sordida TaxID=392033 RepID=A0A815LWK7_9BILA|nr:unnamed protein product [Rotaria sordida]
MYQSILLLVVILTLYAATIAADSLEGRGLMNVCYDDYGCFTSGPPFGLTLHRPIALLPDPPEVIDTRFLLYTRYKKDKGQAISRHTTLGTWDRTKATKILVHGFLDTINSTWWPEMKNAFLEAEDCNVILTDWSRANYFPYTKATANAQVVGADIALLVNKMIKAHGVNPADFHIVAHSLGAAVAGYAGHRISGLGRITGECTLNANEGNFMGYHASPNKARGRLYLNTQRVDKAPYCINHYQIRLISGSNFVQTKGQILLTLTGSQATQSVLLDSDETFLKRSGIETRYIPLTTDLGTIQRVNVKFERAGHLISSLIYSSKWTFTNVTVIDGDRQTSVTFCPENGEMVLESGNTARFYPC